MVLYNVNYLEDGDFNSAGKFNHAGKWVVFIYGDFCPHCHNVMPAVQELANEMKGTQWAAIQIDGARPSEKTLGQRLAKIVAPAQFRGVPMIVSIKNNKVDKVYAGDRSKQSIRAFAEKI